MHNIEYSPEARNDLHELAYAITHSYGMPMTAEEYVRELRAEIEKLKQYPERNAVRDNHFLLQYGTNVRRVNYKKMAIIYTIHNDLVYIHRIMAGALL